MHGTMDIVLTVKFPLTFMAHKATHQALAHDNSKTHTHTHTHTHTLLL